MFSNARPLVAKSALVIGLHVSTAVIGNPAAAQSLTAADLAGIAVDATLVTSQTVRSVKGVTTHQVSYYHTLQIQPEEKLKWSLTIKTTMLDGTTRSRSWKTDATIGKPFAFRDGQGVWILENNALVRLGTLTEGGNTVTIAFEGGGSNLTCKIARAMVKEVGVGKVTSTQTAAGHKIDVLKQTDISSTCRVRKPS